MSNVRCAGDLHGLLYYVWIAINHGHVFCVDFQVKRNPRLLGRWVPMVLASMITQNTVVCMLIK